MPLVNLHPLMSRSRNALIFTPPPSFFLYTSSLPGRKRVFFPSSTVFLSFGLVISKLRPPTLPSFPAVPARVHVSLSLSLFLALETIEGSNGFSVLRYKNGGHGAIGIRYSFGNGPEEEGGFSHPRIYSFPRTRPGSLNYFSARTRGTIVFQGAESERILSLSLNIFYRYT